MAYTNKEIRDKKDRKIRQITEQLSQLGCRDLLLIETDPDFQYYCGYYALRAMKKYGNTVITKEIVEADGVEKTRKTLEKIFGVPVTLTLLPGEAQYDRDVYIADVQDRYNMKEPPAPVYISARMNDNGDFELYLKGHSRRKRRMSSQNGSGKLSIRKDFD